MKVRVIIVGLCVLLAGTALGTWAWLSDGLYAPDPHHTSGAVRVRKDRFVNSLFVSGELAAVRAIRIGAPPFRGRGPFAIKALAPEGSHVEPGELLVQIDNSTLVSTLLTEELNLEKAENDLVKTQAQLEIQMKDLEIQLGQNKLELDKTALKAEIDKELLALRDWQDYQFAFQKAKKEYEKTSKSRELVGKAAREEIGQKGYLTVDSHPGRRFDIAVERMETLARPLEKESPVKYFEVLLKIEAKADEILRPGKMVRARVTVARLTDALVVPRSALSEENRKFFVWVDRPQAPERREVGIGSGDGARIALLSGVREGESVLLNPPKAEIPSQSKESTAASRLSNAGGALQ